MIINIQEEAKEAIKYGLENFENIYEDDNETLKVEIVDYIRDNVTNEIIDKILIKIFEIEETRI